MDLLTTISAESNWKLHKRNDPHRMILVDDDAVSLMKIDDNLYVIAINMSNFSTTVFFFPRIERHDIELDPL